MDPQTAPSRVLLLLLFLHLALPGGRSHPLGSPSSVSDLETSGLQEQRNHLQGKLSELQVEQTSLEPLQKSPHPTGVWKTQEAATEGIRGHRKMVPYTLRARRSPKMVRGSGCFGRKMDRITSSSGLGCKGEQPLPPRPPGPIPVCDTFRVTLGFVVSGNHTL
ncbi:PREDICTED: natriuretic peptides B isoform X1 [Colobus angolensis palliatus]|uniref:natriuretic peptides B isoform X1 n=1 Tax=Colobus angolensis palliatus TaxID=336983 RepID=UPI0005F4C92C|nr:PREDICTED: natriuretic peptides B isoform X1 [Colobus angolensis palliatus]